MQVHEPSPRRTRLSVVSEVSESGCEAGVNPEKGGVLTLGFSPSNDGLVKATKLNKGQRHPEKRPVHRWVYRAQANATF